MPLPPRWDVARGVELYGCGWTLTRIAAEMGVSRQNVQARLGRAGVTFRNRRRHDVKSADIVHLRDVEGLSWRQIEAAVGMSQGTVRNRYAKAISGPTTPELNASTQRGKT